MEETMRGYWLGIVTALVTAATLQPCMAGEFAGRLERVDLQTVTLRGSDNKLVVVRVDQNHRLQAAPYLGRWVTVDFQADHGTFQALGFRCPTSR
jgi:hypothetical protein